MSEGGPGGFTVRIRGADGKVGGLGVLVGERYIVTCAHVVNVALGEQRARRWPEPEARIHVDSPLLTGGQSATAILRAVSGRRFSVPCSAFFTVERDSPVAASISSRKLGNRPARLIVRRKESQAWIIRAARVMR